MAYIIENHRQIRINDIRDRLSDGWLTTYRRNGEIEQKLNATPKSRGIVFTWRRFNEGDLLHQFVELAETPTNFNGKRSWFVCPNCARKCGSLFDYGGVWFCRRCGDLKYTSASGSKSERIINRINFLKSKASLSEFQTTCEYLYEFNRPKRMRLKTWARIVKEHNQLVDKVRDYALKRFGLEL